MDSHKLDLETSIEILSAMKDAICSLIKVYTQLPTLLHEEIDAIKEGNLRIVEKTVEKKKSLATASEMQAAELSKNAHRLMTILKSAKRDLILDETDPDQILDEFTSGLNDIKPVPLEAQVVQHLLHKTKLEFEKLKTSIQTTKTLLQKNQAVISRFLEFHQESYSFWQQITAEGEQTYTARGQKKSSASHSGFSISA